MLRLDANGSCSNSKRLRYEGAIGRERLYGRCDVHGSVGQAQSLFALFTVSDWDCYTRCAVVAEWSHAEPAFADMERHSRGMCRRSEEKL